MLKVVTLKEIEQVFEVLEEFGLSREAVVIPLKPAQPGGVRLLPDDRLEIILDSEIPLEQWLVEVRRQIAAILASGAGGDIRRDDG
ncbi:MAG: hypothetical protein ACRERC_22975 [Candidatus Binatia bacterium]